MLSRSKTALVLACLSLCVSVCYFVARWNHQYYKQPDLRSLDAQLPLYMPACPGFAIPTLQDVQVDCAASPLLFEDERRKSIVQLQDRLEGKRRVIDAFVFNSE